MLPPEVFRGAFYNKLHHWDNLFCFKGLEFIYHHFNEIPLLKLHILYPSFSKICSQHSGTKLDCIGKSRIRFRPPSRQRLHFCSRTSALSVMQFGFPTTKNRAKFVRSRGVSTDSTTQGNHAVPEFRKWPGFLASTILKRTRTTAVLLWLKICLTNGNSKRRNSTSSFPQNIVKAKNAREKVNHSVVSKTLDPKAKAPF